MPRCWEVDDGDNDNDNDNDDDDDDDDDDVDSKDPDDVSFLLRFGDAGGVFLFFSLSTISHRRKLTCP